MLSKTAEYALRAVVCLAECPGRPVTARQAARRARVPVHYLSKVLRALVKAGVVTGLRGHHGGFRLARPADKVSLLQVIDAVDPFDRMEKCPVGLKEHRKRLCPLHRRLRRCIVQLERDLGKSTIADLAGGPRGKRWY